MKTSKERSNIKHDQNFLANILNKNTRRALQQRFEYIGAFPGHILIGHNKRVGRGVRRASPHGLKRSAWKELIGLKNLTL